MYLKTNKMKKIITICAVILMTASVFAQAPNKMSYQAVIRNSSNALITNQAVGMRISILQTSSSGTAVYVETQNPITNANGLASIEIGGGTLVSGNFATINWANGPYFIKTETDPSGGTSYSITGTSQLLSVPYALHASSASSANNGVPAGGSAGQILTLCNGVAIWTTGGQCPGSITALNCGSATNNGNLTSGTAASGVSSSVPYTGSNGGTHNGQTVTSTGVTGLTATLSAGTFASGSGSLTYTISGTPASSGTASFVLSIGGQTCTLSLTVNAGGSGTYPSGSVFCNGPSAIVDVTNPATGKIWMDRNLGATQAATSSTDVNAYGDLYQWGRRSDGHQCRNSVNTTTLSSTDQPAHGDFTTINSGNYDWRSPQNTNLWQGVNGINNPCPSGYRLPTNAELDAERSSWNQNNSAGAFASPLKLPVAGGRANSNGSLGSVGTGGSYWSSTVNGTVSYNLNFTSSNAIMFINYRANGFSVRCLKD
jgi:uncharacterized protein (TIGR02145 family)